MTETVKSALRVNQLKEGLTPGGVGEVLPYMGYVGMCGCEGYGFQAVYYRTGCIRRLGLQWGIIFYETGQLVGDFI